MHPHSRIAAVAAAGVPLTDALRYAKLWRKGSGKLHLRSDCTRGTVETAVNVTRTTKAAWCSRCVARFGQRYERERIPFGKLIAPFEMVMELHGLLERWDSTDPIEAVSLAERARVAALADGELTEHLAKLTDKLNALIGDQLTSPDRVRWAHTFAATLNLHGFRRGNRHPPVGPRKNLPNLTFLHSRRCPLTQAWSKVFDKIHGGASATEAFAAARAAGLEVLPELFHHSLVPKVVRFNGADFAHPDDWARAEWLAAATEELDTALSAWADEIDRLARTSAASETWVTLRGTWSSASDAAILQRLLGPFEAVFDHKTLAVLASVPEMVAEAAKSHCTMSVLNNRHVPSAALRDTMRIVERTSDAEVSQMIDAMELIGT